MRTNLPVTNCEHTFGDDEVLVSMTDTKGTITYANDAFVKISGFTREELIGRPHNIVRHPDMPAAAFKDLWKTILNGKSWMGIVKNRCKNGDYYVVNAFVSPLYEGNQLVGFQSVRIRPEPEAVERALRLYAGLDRGKMPSLGMSFRLRQFLYIAAAFAVLWAAGFVLLAPPLFPALGLFASGLALSFGLAKVLSAPVGALAGQARGVVDNPLMQTVYTGRGDDIGAIRFASLYSGARLVTAMGRLYESSRQIDDSVAHVAGAVIQATHGIEMQQYETDQVATAMNEMAATVQEVANNTANASNAAHGAALAANEGKTIITESVQAIETLAREVGNAAGVIQRLEEDSATISKVLEVINGVAEQTNLLALNAAIEAARAGEMGRGFAVVADEVRTLASRTQASTMEIQQMIEKLQRGSKEAVEVMGRSQEKAQAGVVHAGNAGQALEEIVAAVGVISDMNAQVATAAEEQTAVAEEINRNVHNLAGASEENAGAARDTTDAAADLQRLSRELYEMVRQFSRG